MSHSHWAMPWSPLAVGGVIRSYFGICRGTDTCTIEVRFCARSGSGRGKLLKDISGQVCECVCTCERVCGSARVRLTAE